MVKGLKLRHDHGSQYMADDFQNEIKWLGLESSPSFVRAPEGNGCAEMFIRTLKENLLGSKLSPRWRSCARPCSTSNDATMPNGSSRRLKPPAAVRAEQLTPMALAA